MKITIGICARNEESSIITMLDSVLVSISRNLENIEYHLMICANGCSDQTIPLIKAWMSKHHYINTELFIINEANLIESQRTIVEKSKKLLIRSIIFIDADVIIDENCINKFVKDSHNDEIKAAYAVSVPIERKKKTLIEKALNLYDTSENIYSPRKHLHGRTFLIKTDAWNIPKTTPKLVTDDIYLSFYLLKNFGEKSIKKVPEAKVYFNQVSTYHDFYNAYRRRNIEVKKCFDLFPDFKSLPPDQVNRKFIYKNLLKESPNNVFLWIFLLLIKRLAKLQLDFERLFGIEENNLWIPTKSSKKLNYNQKPILILIEGLDCSGKKTTARMLQEKLINCGISCMINIGPLYSKTYRLISRFVSLHRFPNFIRSFVYALDGLGDRKWYKVFNSQVVIQISSPMRNWSYSIVNKKHFRVFIMHLIKGNLPKCDLIYYLTAPYETRIERHASQVKFKENPDELKSRFPGKQVFDKMEVELKKLLNENGKINGEYDTTISKYDDITNNIAFIIKKMIV